MTSKVSISRGNKVLVYTASVGLMTAYLLYPGVTGACLMAVAGLAVVWMGYASTDWLVTFQHRREWITPLHKALHKQLQVDDSTKPGSYIKIPRDFRSREKIGMIKLPKEYTGSGQDSPTQIIKSKLALGDVTVSYRLAGRNPHIMITQAPRPPEVVHYRDHHDHVATAKESAPFIGVGPRNCTVSVDLDTESPHILVSASTGGGKSVILQTITSQMLHRGSQMLVLDFKRHSHKWARGLDGVSYCRDIEEIHDALVAMGVEGHRRNRIVDEWDGKEGAEPVGPRLAIVVEEGNATMSKLKRYWSETRTKEDPKESPAISALREILFMGRAVKMHVLLVAQSATAAALGGPEVRECFAVRILARYTMNAWKMLVPEVSPIPRSNRHRGRAQVVLAGEATETQVLYMTSAEAAEWASSGTVAPPPLSRHASHTSSTRENTPVVSRDVTPVLTLVKGATRLYTLASAAREGVVPLSADALRQAKRRDPEFPAGKDGKWTEEELKNWFRNRPARSA